MPKRHKINTTDLAFPKRHPKRDRKYLDDAKGKPCFVCGANDGTTVAAHVNYQNYARGMKASDDRTAVLCASCHASHDQHGDIADWWMKNYVLPLLESNYEGWKNG